MARIKVLEILEAAAGGALRHLFQIAEHIDKGEFDLTAAVSRERMRDAESDVRRLEELGVRVEVVPMLRRPAPVSDLVALRRLVRLMRSGGFDVVHTHSSKAGFLGRLAARRAGIRRVFYTPHAFAFQCGGLRGRVYRRLERIAGGFGGRIVAVSEGERALAVEGGIVPPERVCVAPNGVEDPGVPGPAERERARAGVGLPVSAIVVGTVGRLARQKAPDDLIEAAAEALRDCGDMYLLIVGSGPLAARLVRLADSLGVSGRVVFAGERADAADLYAAMDIYVQPSLWEGLPYALLDAMVRGLPAVATDISGHRDVVEDGVTGLRVPPSDRSALARAILSLAGDADRRAELGAAGRELVRRNHSVGEFIRSIEALYGSGVP